MLHEKYAVYPNDSDQETIKQEYKCETLKLFDLEDFLYSSLQEIIRLSYGYRNLNRLWPRFLQNKQIFHKHDVYYRKIINNKISLFPQLQLQEFQMIEGKRYKNILYSELMFKLHPQKMVCCICEKEILLTIVEQHSQLCLKKHQLNQQLYEIQENIREFSEEINTKEIELITKINLFTKSRQSEKNLSHQNSPTNNARSKQQISLSKFAQQSEQKRGLQRAKTINISEDNSISEFPTFHQRNQFRNKTRVESSISPDSQKQIKCAISLLKVTSQYCAKVLLQENAVGMDIDAKFQSLIKFGLPEINHLNDVSELMKKALNFIHKRIDINKYLNKIEATQKQQQFGSIEKLKKSFQKGLSNSYKLQGTSSSNRIKKLQQSKICTSKQRIMDLVKQKSQFNVKVFKEDQDDISLNQQITPTLDQRNDSMDFVTYSPSEENLEKLDQQQLQINVFSQQGNDSDQDSDSVNQKLYMRGYYSDSGITMRINYNIKKIMNVGLHDFEFLEVLGVGAYGAVWKVRKLKTHDVYAMKVIDTQQQSSQNFLETLKAETTIFSVLEGDFVAKAYYSFSQGDCLFYLLEYVKGGDFDKILQKYGALDELIAKFYIAELLLAIETLHKKNIIHRDLKPQNILVDGKGHLKLTDFGLSEIGMQLYMQQTQQSKAIQLQNKLNSNIKNLITEPQSPRFDNCISPKTSFHSKHRIVGTPDYIAPEVIKGESINNESIDLWSLGVITYEFLVGIPPFNDDTPEKIFENILQMNITWPEIGDQEDQLSEIAKDFIVKLLDPDYQTRMTVDQAKIHPFFQNINFQTIREQSAPIIPDNNVDDQPLLLLKKQREKEKLTKLLKDTSSENSTISKLGVDNLLRLDLLVEMNEQKAKQLRRKYNY